MNFSFPYAMRNGRSFTGTVQEGAEGHPETKLPFIVETDDRTIEIGFQGYGEADAAIGYGRPITIEFYEGKLILRVWAEGFVSVGRLMLHELCHHSPDIEDHDHDQAFYEEFHDHSDSIGDFATTLMACLPSICESLKKKLTKHTLVNQDQQVRMEEAIAKFPNVRIRKP